MKTGVAGKMDVAAKTGVLVQVRLASTRLTEKALLPLEGLPVIRHVMRALLAVQADVFALITDRESHARLAGLAEAEGFDIFQGSSDDVLGRYCRAAAFYGVDRIIRATGDNPLVSARMTDAIVAVHRQRGADLSHYLGLPLGTGVEVIQAEALEAAEKTAQDPAEREHMSTHLYRNPDRFRVVEEPCPEAFRFEGRKVSLDTRQDYAFLAEIYRELYRGEPIEIDRLVPWLRRRASEGACAETSSREGRS